MNICNPVVRPTQSFVTLQPFHHYCHEIPLRRILLTLLLFSWLLHQTAYAQTEDCIASNSCIAEYSWDVGIAAGIGARTNPLVDGDSLPNLLLLDVAWYGQHGYFDNGEVGYKWLEQDSSGFETYVTLDREAAFFNFWHPGNFTISFSSASPTPGAPNPDNPDVDDQSLEVSSKDIASRRWAIHAGGRYHLYADDSEWTFSIESDVSSVHKGHKAAITYQYLWRGDNWSFRLKPSLTWKSDGLVNYYYGLSARDSLASEQTYFAKGGLQPAISILYTRRINQNWQWIVNASYQKLHAGMTDSPLVERSNISSVFFGAGYRF